MPSLYEVIRAQRMPRGPSAALVLPDEPPDDPAPYGGPRIRWAAGARDGVAVFHLPGRKPGFRQVAPIVDSLLTWVREQTDASRKGLEETVVRAVGEEAFVPFVGPVLDRLDELLDREQSLAPHQLPDATRRLLLETEERDSLKLAIALLGPVGEASDREVLETVGMHDEFTFYAVDALANTLPDPIDSWMLFAVSLTGWGKIHSVLALVEELPEPGPKRDEVVRYLLRYGCENGVQNGYLALPIATAAGLHQALALPRPEPDLLVGAGVILSSLAEDAATGGPSGDMGEYPEGALATRLFLEQLRAAPAPASERLDLFLAVASLKSFVLDTVPQDKGRWQAMGWDEGLCRAVAGMAADHLAQPQWKDRALQGLADGEPAERWKARAVCRVLEVPMATELEFVVGADPSDVGAWFDLSEQADREGMERAASIAPGLLRFDKLFAGGPGTTLGFGPDFPRFEICDALADGLSRFPGSGGPFLRKLLESPSVRNRHSALRAYEKWPQLGPADREAIGIVAGGDPDGRVREHAEKLKLEKA